MGFARPSLSLPEPKSESETVGKVHEKELPTNKVQIVVTFKDMTTWSFDVENGWRFDNVNRQIIIGKKSRSCIPLDNVHVYEVIINGSTARDDV